MYSFTYKYSARSEIENVKSHLFFPWADSGEKIDKSGPGSMLEHEIYVLLT